MRLIEMDEELYDVEECIEVLKRSTDMREAYLKFREDHLVMCKKAPAATMIAFCHGFDSVRVPCQPTT